jgi:3'(2'), 5'-bisphosphate nucleotidase
MTREHELEVAVAAVRAASRLCEKVRQSLVGQAMEKADRSPVTVADYGSQAVVCHALAQAFPQDIIVAEEGAAELGTPQNQAELAKVVSFVGAEMDVAGSADVLAWIDRGATRPKNGRTDRFWTLDPIDGTKGFLRSDQYAVALALIEDGVVQLGVLGCPLLPPTLDGGTGEKGTLFAAVRGEGAWMSTLESDKRTKLDPRATRHSRLVESVESGHGDHERQERVAQAAGFHAPPLRMDSQAKYAVVARGEGALYLRLPSPRTPDYREKIWDHAAGALIVAEAGGQVTDMGGRPLRFNVGETLAQNVGVVVSRGIDHAAVLAALR